jgi:hypothetical protein
MEDKRLTRRLTDYWDRLRKDNPLPQWAQLNTGAISDVWGQCSVWRVEIGRQATDSIAYTYEYVGKNTKEAMGTDMTGELFLTKFRNFPGVKLTKNIDSVVKNRVPEYDEGSFINEKQKLVKFRSCLLPFGTTEGRVTHILLGLSWKAF